MYFQDFLMYFQRPPFPRGRVLGVKIGTNKVLDWRKRLVIIKHERVSRFGEVVSFIGKMVECAVGQQVVQRRSEGRGGVVEFAFGGDGLKLIYRHLAECFHGLNG